MVRIHIVSEGEHMAAIAQRYGFRDYRTVWSHPENEQLRAVRSPHVLAPSDRVTIPDFESRVAEGNTEKRHTFRVRTTRLVLRIAFQDVSGKPLSEIPCEIETSSQPVQATTDSDGLVSVPIEPSTLTCDLALSGICVTARVGYLDPVETVTGWQARLANLGYYAGAIGDEEDQRSRLAIEEFQLESDLRVTGIVDAETLAALSRLHGC